MSTCVGTQRTTLTHPTYSSFLLTLPIDPYPLTVSIPLPTQYAHSPYLLTLPTDPTNSPYLLNIYLKKMICRLLKRSEREDRLAHLGHPKARNPEHLAPEIRAVSSE